MFIYISYSSIKYSILYSILYSLVITFLLRKKTQNPTRGHMLTSFPKSINDEQYFLSIIRALYTGKCWITDIHVNK